MNKEIVHQVSVIIIRLNFHCSASCMCCVDDVEVWEVDELNELEDLPQMVKLVSQETHPVVLWISYFLA